MSRKFWFTYFPYPHLDPSTGKEIEVFRPTVPIQISYKDKVTTSFQALIDSGSDRNLFPAEIGELVGLDIKKGETRPIHGIGGVKISSFTHEITLYIEKCKFVTMVDFSYEQQVPLLGREGFFSLFKRVDFNHRKKEVHFKV